MEFLYLIMVIFGTAILTIVSFLLAPDFWQAVFDVFNEITDSFQLDESKKVVIWATVGWVLAIVGSWKILGILYGG